MRLQNQSKVRYQQGKCQKKPSQLNEIKTKAMKTEKYIANGRIFKTFEEVEKYAKERNLRITNTETIRKDTFLISLNS